MEDIIELLKEEVAECVYELKGNPFGEGAYQFLGYTIKSDREGYIVGSTTYSTLEEAMESVTRVIIANEYSKVMEYIKETD